MFRPAVVALMVVALSLAGLGTPHTAGAADTAVAAPELRYAQPGLAIASHADGWVIAAVKQDGRLYTRHGSHPNGWESWVRHGRSTWASVDIAHDASSGETMLLGLKRDGRMFTRSAGVDGQWGAWVQHGRPDWATETTPAIALDGSGAAAVVAVKDDGRLYSRTGSVDNTWNAWSKPYGQATWAAADVDMHSGAPLAVGLKADGRLYRIAVGQTEDMFELLGSDYDSSRAPAVAVGSRSVDTPQALEANGTYVISAIQNDGSARLHSGVWAVSPQTGMVVSYNEVLTVADVAQMDVARTGGGATWSFVVAFVRGDGALWHGALAGDNTSLPVWLGEQGPAGLPTWDTQVQPAATAALQPAVGDSVTRILAIKADGRLYTYDLFGLEFPAVFTQHGQPTWSTSGAVTSKAGWYELTGHDGERLDARASIGGISNNDGRVVFVSAATNATPEDINEHVDVFVYDLATRVTTNITAGANGDSGRSGISGNGRYVVFTSDADNLVAGDTNGVSDVFRHDLQTGETIRVSVDQDGSQLDRPASGSQISNDGNVVLFRGAAIFWIDVATGVVHERAGSGATLRPNGSEVLYEPVGLDDQVWAKTTDGASMSFVTTTKFVVHNDCMDPTNYVRCYESWDSYSLAGVSNEYHLVRLVQLRVGARYYSLSRHHPGTQTFTHLLPLSATDLLELRSFGFAADGERVVAFQEGQSYAPVRWLERVTVGEAVLIGIADPNDGLGKGYRQVSPLPRVDNVVFGTNVGAYALAGVPYIHRMPA